MYTIILKNNKKISGKTWEEAVEKLKDSTLLFQDQSMEEYMAGSAERLKTLKGKEITYTDAESFLKELARMGVIQVEDDSFLRDLDRLGFISILDTQSRRRRTK